jgi:hypothetical protein
VDYPVQQLRRATEPVRVTGAGGGAARPTRSPRSTSRARRACTARSSPRATRSS